MKPAVSSGGLRRVVMLGDLIEEFFRNALTNSGKGLETLGTLGGSLSKDQLVVTHLLIPRQVSKSDSCTMEDQGLLDMLDTHNKENIIFMGKHFSDLVHFLVFNQADNDRRHNDCKNVPSNVRGKPNTAL